MGQSLMNIRITSSLKAFLNIAILSTIFYDFGFLDVLCGPMAIPSDPNLFFRISLIEFFNSQYALLGIFVENTNRRSYIRKLLESYSFKYLVLFIIKLLFIVFTQSHRSKYYIHTLLIEISIISVCFFFDLSSNKNILEIADLTVIDMLNKISILYMTTRTFCPKFALYWFVSNLLFIIMTQIESHLKFFSKQYLGYPKFESALYVKQDIHRFLLFTLVYFGVFGWLQIGVYGYGMLILFAISFFPIYKGFKYFDESKLTQSLYCLTIAIVCIIGYIYMRIMYNQMFKPLFLEVFTCKNEPIFLVQNITN